MKLLALLCSLLLPLNAPAQTNAPPKMTFAFGVCAGVVLGLGTGITIVVVIRCWQRPPPMVQDTNAPVWTQIPPEIPATNAPPGTNLTATIDAGDAVEHVDISNLNVGFNEGFRFMLEASDDGEKFYPLYEVRGWWQGDTAIIAAYLPEIGICVASDYRARSSYLPVPLTKGRCRFYRVRKP